MNRVLVSMLLAFSAIAFAQAPQHKSEADTLARPVDWGNYSPKLFQDLDRKITFSLRTSWIPGEKHQGMFRYIISARPDRLSIAQMVTGGSGPDTSDSITKLVKRVHDCIITLELYDSDQFILRRIAVPFGFGVDSDANITSLYANDTVQMDMAEYKNFIGSTGKTGAWAVSWECDPLGPKE